MAGVINFTPSAITWLVGRFKRVPNSRVSYVRSSAETPVTSKEEPPELGVSTSTPTFSAPPNFKPPQPKPFSVRPDKLFDILGASLALIFRLGTGAVVSGYSASFVSKDEVPSDQYALELAGFKIKETSKVGPRPELPIEIYEFESCPFCRKVREIVAILDLDVLYYPCPRNGPNFRPKAAQMGGKQQFPYMTLTEGFAMIGRMGKGISYTPLKLPVKPLEVWAYEPSPFCKVVREVLVELELPHILHSCACGSPKRQILYEKAVHFQVPYLEDPNTGVQMFESAEIVEYVKVTYAL